MKKLSDFRIIIFDVYGTLMDVRKGVIEGLRPLLDRYPSITSNWSNEQIWNTYDEIEHAIEREFPKMRMTDVILKVWDTMEERLIQAVSAATTDQDKPPVSVKSDDNDQDRLSFGQGVKTYPLFPDTTEALHRLSKHYHLTILSNMDHTGIANSHAKMAEGLDNPSDEILKAYSYPSDFHESATARGAQSPFLFPLRIAAAAAKQQASSSTSESDITHTRTKTNSPFTMIAVAQDTGVYKPNLGGFQMVLKAMGNEMELFGTNGDEEELKGKVLSVAQSLPHDHVPAQKLGLHSVWIDRQKLGDEGAKTKYPQASYNWRFETLAQFADALDNES